MADRVVLHVGTMKSGTTYLQRSLESGVLEGAGGFYVGGAFGAQTAAVRGILGARDQQRLQVWNRLLGEVRRREGVAVYSQEFLGFARRHRARQVVKSFEGTPVDVVLTVRDQHGAMPAQWQSFVRNRGTDDWATYVHRLMHMDEEGPVSSKAVRSFRRAQDVPDMLRRWSRAGVSGVTVVTVPPAGAPPTQLWRRFCEAARIEVGDPPEAAAKSNESLGYASCEVLRRVNVAVEELGREEFQRVRRLVLDALLPLRPDEGRPELDGEGAAYARELNRRIAGVVTGGDIGLVGSLSELPVEESRPHPVTILEPDPDHVVRALRTVWAGCLPDEGPPSEDPDVLADLLGQRLVGRARG